MIIHDKDFLGKSLKSDFDNFIDGTADHLRSVYAITLTKIEENSPKMVIENRHFGDKKPEFAPSFVH